MEHRSDGLLEYLAAEPREALLGLVGALCADPAVRKRAAEWCCAHATSESSFAGHAFLAALERLFEDTAAFLDPDDDEGTADAVYAGLDAVTRLGAADDLPFFVRQTAALRLLGTENEVCDELGILDTEAFRECALSLCRTDAEREACGFAPRQ